MRGYSRGFVYLSATNGDGWDLFVGFLDFSEVVDDIVFRVNIFRVDFERTSTALESVWLA